MALGTWQGTITDNAGNVILNPEITVLREAPGLPPAACFADKDGLTALGSEFNANEANGNDDGYVRFYVTGGFYRITASSGGFLRTWRDVPIGTAQGLDIPVTFPSSGIFNVIEYGAIGDNNFHPLSERYSTLGEAQAVYPFVTSLTQQIDWAGIQAAIAAADAHPSLFNANVVCFPPGSYRVDGITSSRPHTYLGAGKKNTYITLTDGHSNTPVWAHFLPGTAGGPSPAFFSPPKMRGFHLDGNKAGNPTNCAGLTFPAPAWDILTSYGLCVDAEDIDATNCSGAAFYVDVNRNGASFTNCNWADCPDGFVNASYDSRFFNCNGFGALRGFNVIAGGAIELVCCSPFSNENPLLIGPNVNAYVKCIGCVFDGSTTTLISIDGDNRQSMDYSFISCLFGNVGSASSGSHPAIALTDAHGVNVIGSFFNRGISQASYLVLIQGTSGPVHWSGNHFSQVVGEVPYAVDVTNDHSRLLIAGDVLSSIRRSVGGVAVPGNVAVTGDVTASGTTEFFRALNAQLTNDGANPGPYIALSRISASPAAADNLGVLLFEGRNSAAAALGYAGLQARVLDPTAASEDSELALQAVTGGVYGDVLSLADGVKIGLPTGGYKGAGTLNCAGDIFKNNSAYGNPDYVFEYAFTGQIVKYSDNPGAEEYQGRLPLDRLEAHLREHHRLPGMTNTPAGMFERGDKALEKIEELTLYILELHKRLAVLEKKTGVE